MARGGGAQLLVVADQEQLLRGRIDRGEHVRLEHLGSLLHHKHTAAELAHERLVLRRAGGGQTNDGRPLEHRECVELIELAHGCRDPAVLGQSDLELAQRRLLRILAQPIVQPPAFVPVEPARVPDLLPVARVLRLGTVAEVRELKRRERGYTEHRLHVLLRIVSGAREGAGRSAETHRLVVLPRDRVLEAEPLQEGRIRHLAQLVAQGAAQLGRGAQHAHGQWRARPRLLYQDEGTIETVAASSHRVAQVAPRRALNGGPMLLAMVEQLGQVVLLEPFRL